MFLSLQMSTMLIILYFIIKTIILRLYDSKSTCKTINNRTSIDGGVNLKERETWGNWNWNWNVGGRGDCRHRNAKFEAKKGDFANNLAKLGGGGSAAMTRLHMMTQCFNRE